MHVSEQVIIALEGIITGDERGAPFYRSGPTLVNFFNQFGGDDEYGWGFPSRGSYTANKLREANGTATMREIVVAVVDPCLLYTSPSPRDRTRSRMPSSA